MVASAEPLVLAKISQNNYITNQTLNVATSTTDQSRCKKNKKSVAGFWLSCFVVVAVVVVIVVVVVV